MSRILFYILLLFFTIQIYAQSQQSFSSLSELRSQLDELFDDPNFSGATWGVMIQSLENGEIIYKKNADKLFIPASAIKIITSSAGLLLLGSDFKYRTEILTDGRIENNKLKGNLIIKGSGDPTISGRFFEKNITRVFTDWTDSIKNKDVNEITGKILGDDDLFDENYYGQGWHLDYKNEWFAAPAGALAFNNNLFEIICEGTSENLPAKIYTNPDLNNFTLINKVITSGYSNKNRIDLIKSESSEMLTIAGNIGVGTKEKKYFPVNNPTKYFVNVLKDILEKENICVKGYSADMDEEISPPEKNDLMEIFLHSSVSLNQIVTEINKNSDNFYAEQLLKTIGAEIYGTGSVDAGTRAIKNLLKTIGINPENLILADGSGLSRLSLVTPKQIIKVLNYLYTSNEFDSFYLSLPIAGSDGTLAERMKKTSAENNVRAKPGFLPGVKTLAGYVNTADNEPLAFCFFVNNFLVPSSVASNTQDAACIQLANFKRK